MEQQKPTELQVAQVRTFLHKLMEKKIYMKLNSEVVPKVVKEFKFESKQFVRNIITVLVKDNSEFHFTEDNSGKILIMI